MVTAMPPEQAFSIVRQVCDAHQCNKQTRVAIEQALATLRPAPEPETVEPEPADAPEPETAEE